MPFTVTTCSPASPTPASQVVHAEEHTVEGGWHVFRRTTLVMASPRTVVVLRLPVASVLEVRPARA